MSPLCSVHDMLHIIVILVLIIGITQMRYQGSHAQSERGQQSRVSTGADRSELWYGANAF